MIDTNLPEGTGGSEALSFEDGVDSLTDVLKYPETDGGMTAKVIISPAGTRKLDVVAVGFVPTK